MIEKFLRNKAVSVKSDNQDCHLNLKLSDPERYTIVDYFYLLKEIGIFFDNFYHGVIDYYKKSILGDFKLSGSIEELKIFLRQRLDQDIDFLMNFIKKFWS